MGCDRGNGMRLPGCVCNLEVAKIHQEGNIRQARGLVAVLALISDILKPNWKVFRQLSSIVG